MPKETKKEVAKAVDDQDDQREEEEPEEDEDNSGANEDDGDTGLTDNQNRLLYLVSLYSKPAFTADEKEEWLRKSALLVLLYEGITAQVFDYDYAPASELIGFHRRFINLTQEGKTDIDFLREEELLNGLKISSKSHTPLTCYQISEKGLALLSKIGKEDKAPVQELVFAPGTRNLLQIEWDGESYWLGDPKTGYQRISTITDVESVSYVSSAYIPQHLRDGGRPTLSNAHRSHECGSTQGSLRDELDEVITLNSVSIIVGEYIPFGPNRVVQLNENLGSADRVQGGFFTAKITYEPPATHVQIDPGMTQIHILDYSITEHINIEADIHFPESPGVVQVETFGCHINSLGTCFYGMQIEAIMDRIKDNMSLDHLSRLLVDVQTDSSRIIDSIISPHQRELLELIFSGEALKRNKMNLIIANEINPHLTAEEYMDKGEYENELRQVIGDTRASYDISEHDTLVFGADGLLIAGPNARHHEPLLCAYMQFVALDSFLRNYYNRVFILLDDMKQLRKDLENFHTDPSLWERIRQELIVLDKQTTMLEEVLGYLDESQENFTLPSEPAEQAGRALFERLQLKSLQEKIARRTKDLFKIIGGARRELEMLRDIQTKVGEIRSQKVAERVQENTRNVSGLIESQERSNRLLEVLQFILSATLSFEILDRITGDWTVVNTSWMKSFVEGVLVNGPGVWFILNMVFWGLVGYVLLSAIRLIREALYGQVTVQVKRFTPIDIAALSALQKRKILLEESHIFDGSNRICRVVWQEPDAREWGATRPIIQLEYDEQNSFLLQIFVAYNPSKLKSKRNIVLTASELETKILQDLDRAKVFTRSLSAASSPHQDIFAEKKPESKPISASDVTPELGGSAKSAAGPVESDKGNSKQTASQASVMPTKALDTKPPT